MASVTVSALLTNNHPIANSEYPIKKAINPAIVIDGKIDEATQKRDTAQNLLDYMKAPPNERVPPELGLEEMLGLVDAENQQEWQKVVRYYNGFILK